MTIPRNEWLIAREEFNKDNSPEFLPCTIRYDEAKAVQPRVNKTPASYQLSHSFIQHQGRPYAVAKGKEHLVGRGSYGVVKKLLTESDLSKHVVKIQKYETPHSEKNIQREQKITKDLGLSDFLVKHPVKKKYYMQMVNAGIVLQNFMPGVTSENHELRFEIAIKLSLQVGDLHLGILSHKHISYAHLDISPNNVLYDPTTHEVRLIDFDSAQVNAFSPKIPSTFSVPYTVVREFHDVKEITGEFCDVFSLLRLLHLPEKGYRRKNNTFELKRSSDETRKKSILTDEMIAQYGLECVLTDSTHYSKRKSKIAIKNAYDLASILLCAKHMGIEHQSLSRETRLQYLNFYRIYGRFPDTQSKEEKHFHLGPLQARKLEFHSNHTLTTTKYQEEEYHLLAESFNLLNPLFSKVAVVGFRGGLVFANFDSPAFNVFYDKFCEFLSVSSEVSESDSSPEKEFFKKLNTFLLSTESSEDKMAPLTKYYFEIPGSAYCIEGLIHCDDIVQKKVKGKYSGHIAMMITGVLAAGLIRKYDREGKLPFPMISMHLFGDDSPKGDKKYFLICRSSSDSLQECIILDPPHACYQMPIDLEKHYLEIEEKYTLMTLQRLFYRLGLNVECLRHCISPPKAIEEEVLEIDTDEEKVAIESSRSSNVTLASSYNGRFFKTAGLAMGAGFVGGGFIYYHLTLSILSSVSFGVFAGVFLLLLTLAISQECGRDNIPAARLF